MPFFLGDRQITGLNIDQRNFIVKEERYQNPRQLLRKYPDGNEFAYMVGEDNAYSVFIWDENEKIWTDVGNFGPLGDTLVGPRGFRGIGIDFKTEEEDGNVSLFYRTDEFPPDEDYKLIITFKEGDRDRNEQERINAENQRISQEQTRQEQEASRMSSETVRELNEVQRIENENQRILNEEQRQQNESIRLQQEEDRVAAENIRIENENERIAAEDERISTEDERIAAENQRISDENQRIANEDERIAAEEARKLAEDARVEAENVREENEALRKQNEEDRIEAELQRAQNEQAREEAEQIREEAEQIRVETADDFSKFIINREFVSTEDSDITTQDYQKYNIVWDLTDNKIYECINPSLVGSSLKDENYFRFILQSSATSTTTYITKEAYNQVITKPVNLKNGSYFVFV